MSHAFTTMIIDATIASKCTIIHMSLQLKVVSGMRRRRGKKIYEENTVLNAVNYISFPLSMHHSTNISSMVNAIDYEYKKKKIMAYKCIHIRIVEAAAAKQRPNQ